MGKKNILKSESANEVDFWHNTAMTDFYALIPAAGSGSRMQGPVPKQYLELLGQPLLWYTLSSLMHPLITHVYIVLAPGDSHFGFMNTMEFQGRITPLYCGGESRSQSVRNGLKCLENQLQADDFILVHDAARPCLDNDSLDRLLELGSKDPVGAILGLPVRDTLKRMGPDCTIENTVDREGLWVAQTPQMFRYGLLCNALYSTTHQPTDEAQALEEMGQFGKLVEGCVENLKITWPGDLKIARLILEARRVKDWAGV